MAVDDPGDGGVGARDVADDGELLGERQPGDEDAGVLEGGDGVGRERRVRLAVARGRALGDRARARR